MSRTGLVPGKLGRNRLAPFEGEKPEVPGSPPPPYVPPGPPPIPAGTNIDALINDGLFEACMSPQLNAKQLALLGHFESSPLETIRALLTEDVEPVILQERRNSLMLWPEAWNAMSVDQFATEILKLIGSETASNRNAYAFIRETLQTAIDTTRPVLTLRDVITALSLQPDRENNSYMNIPLDTYIHLKKILVRHTLIYNISPLQKVINTYNSLHGDPIMKQNSTTILTMNGAIVQTILFGIYDVHDPDHLVKQNGIVVGFAPTFSNLWRSKQQVKAQVYLSGKPVKESLSGIKDYADAKEQSKAPGSKYDTYTVDLYGHFREDYSYANSVWNNPEPRIVSFLLNKLKSSSEQDQKDVFDTLRVIWEVPGPETKTFIHMFTDNAEFRGAIGNPDGFLIKILENPRLGPIPGNLGYVKGQQGFNINRPGISPYPGYPGLNVAPERRGSGSGDVEIGGGTLDFRSELGTRHLGNNGSIRWRGSNTGKLLPVNLGGARPKRKTRSKLKSKGRKTRSKK